MMNDTEMMAKVAEVNPEAYNYLLKTAGEIRQSPFRDEIVAELSGIMKKAMSAAEVAGDVAEEAPGWGARAAQGFNKLPKAVRWGAGAMAAGVALNLGGDLYEAAKRGLTKGRHYKKMLEANPDLRGKAKTPFVRRHFNTLHRFNPEYAGDPNVAGSYVRQNMEMATDDLNGIHALVKARRDVQSARALTQANPFKQIDLADG